MALVINDVERRVSAAVAHYWSTLAAQSVKQRGGDADRGGRAAVTGGKQMDGFCHVVREMLRENGLPSTAIYTDRYLEIPGFFRPTKRWDLLVVFRGHLLAAMEFKSQRGPSFGNNFNNRKPSGLPRTCGRRFGKARLSRASDLGWVG